MPDKQAEYKKDVVDDTIFDLINSNGNEKVSGVNEKRKQREKEKIRSRKANRATYDIIPELRQYIKLLSEKEHIPASQFVSLALLRFLVAYESGEIDLSTMKQSSRSPRYDWNITYPANLLKVLMDNIKVVKVTN